MNDSKVSNYWMVSVTLEIFNRQNIKLTKGVYEDKELT